MPVEVVGRRVSVQDVWADLTTPEGNLESIRLWSTVQALRMLNIRIDEWLLTEGAYGQQLDSDKEA